MLRGGAGGASALSTWVRIGGLVSSQSNVEDGQKRIVEKLWQEFFADPCCWWDNRLEKVNSRYPDFKHKKTKESLWLNSKLKPPWVEAELASMAPGLLQIDRVTWNKLLTTYAKAGKNHKTMELFQQMQKEGMKPDNFTFVPVIKACSSLRALEDGRRIHLQIRQASYESDVYISASLVDMYANCGCIPDAQIVFDKMPVRNVVVWNALILGHVKCGHGRKALELSKRMQQEGVDPDPVTFVGMLNACCSVAALEEGRRIHEQVIQRGFESNVFIGSSLVDLYAKCGSIEDAQIVFDKMPTHDVVAWSAMILGHVKCGEGQQALKLCRLMQHEGVDPDCITFVGMLTACASVGALKEGRRIHEQIIERDWESNVFLGSSLVDMYAKCGSIEDAKTVFRRMPTRNVVTWNAMLGGYAMHGHAEDALKHSERMQCEGVEMNGVTFLSLLAACNHGRLVNEGLHYFEIMTSVNRLSPAVDHYASLVDLFGRAGHLHEAEELIKTMACEPSASVWKSLLGACRVHGNVEMGEQLGNQVLELEPEDAAGYVLLSNIYADAGRWNSSENVQRERFLRGLKKSSGFTWIELNSEVHSFQVNDHKHPRMVEIHAELRRLSRQIEEAAYVPEK